LTQVTLHAELAGGLRNGVKSNIVQRGTNYSEDQFLYFYDIRIFDGTKIINVETEEEVEEGTVLNPLESK
jgi:hypothetical protein